MLPRLIQIRPRARGQLVRFILGNSVSLILGLYALKCIVFMHGKIPVHEPYTSRYFFYLAEVKGLPSVLTGLGYMGLATFASLSCGTPPDEDCSWTWRISRGVLRWGSLIGGFLAWQKVYTMRL